MEPYDMKAPDNGLRRRRADTDAADMGRCDLDIDMVSDPDRCIAHVVLAMRTLQRYVAERNVHAGQEVQLDLLQAMARVSHSRSRPH
jgi:hypothetical protein